MAEKDKKAEVSEAPEGESAGKKKFPMKALIVLLAVVLIEGVAISAVFMVSGKPAEVSAAQGAEKDEALKLEQPIEELVVSDKFQNTRTGRTYLYDTEVYIVVRQRHLEQAQGILEAKKAQIRQDIRTIMSRAEPAQLLEPTLATLTRQIQSSLDEKLGRDAQEGKPLIEKVLITKCTQFRADM